MSISQERIEHLRWNRHYSSFLKGFLWGNKKSTFLEPENPTLMNEILNSLEAQSVCDVHFVKTDRNIDKRHISEVSIGVLEEKDVLKNSYSKSYIVNLAVKIFKKNLWKS